MRPLIIAVVLALACVGCVTTGAARLDPVSCDGPGAPAVESVSAEDVDAPPTLIGGLEALQRRLQIPDAARRQSAAARAVVRFVVAADGTVVCSDAVQGNNGFFNDAARRAVHASAFEPAQNGGEPVAAITQLAVSYRVSGQAAGGRR
jgi:TonB family protein